MLWHPCGWRYIGGNAVGQSVAIILSIFLMPTADALNIILHGGRKVLFCLFLKEANTDGADADLPLKYKGPGKIVGQSVDMDQKSMKIDFEIAPLVVIQ